MIHAIDLQLVLPPTKDCEQLDNQIKRLVVNQDYWAKQLNEVETQATKKYLAEKRKLYEEYNCLNVISKTQVETINDVSQVFTEQDKIRITAETEKTFKNKIIIGVLTLVSGLIIIGIFSNKKIIK